jgi:hypothetical protein
MCFSATASFTASAVIAGAGVISLKRSENGSQRFLSLVPILFSMQQVVEGFVWLSFTNPQIALYRHMLTVLFLVFAWVVWPVVIPLALAGIEKHKGRKRILYIISFIGALLTIIYMVLLYYGFPEPKIDTFHIDYYLAENPDFFPRQNFSWVYLITTVLPFFISSNRRVWLLGLVNLTGLVIAFVFYRHALPSTWCFFAAISSMVIIYVISGLNSGLRSHSSN